MVGHEESEDGMVQEHVQYTWGLIKTFYIATLFMDGYTYRCLDPMSSKQLRQFVEVCRFMATYVHLDVRECV